MADHSRPTLSLIVPVYGVEKYIGDCLDSIIGATGFAEHCELVLVDDGSLDGSMAIAEERCAPLDNVTILRQPNAGLGAARNTGLRHASGRYIWFVDSDDEIGPDALTVLAACIERHAPGAIAFEFETMGGSLNRAPYLAIYDERIDPVDFMLSGRPPSGSQFYAFERDMLTRNHLCFEPGIYHEDALFTPLALVAAGSLVRLHDTCYRYRLRPGSIMAISDPARHLHDMMRVIDGLVQAARTHDRGSGPWKALGWEIGFAFGAARFYCARTRPRERRRIMPLAYPLSIARPYLTRFSGRNLINHARLVLSLARGALA